jgi:hypothetical protein
LQTLLATKEFTLHRKLSGESLQTLLIRGSQREQTDDMTDGCKLISASDDARCSRDLRFLENEKRVLASSTNIILAMN